MPGPYTTALDVLAQARPRLNLAEDTPPPEHWQGLAASAVRRAYAQMIGLLGRRGYTPAAVDSWAFKGDYNRDLAVAILFRQSGFAQERLGEAVRLELEALEKELGDDDGGLTLFDAGGTVITPDVLASGAADGRQPQVEADLDLVRRW